MFTIEIFRSIESAGSNGEGCNIERLPGTTIQNVTMAQAAKILKGVAVVGIQGAHGNCNDVSIKVTKSGKLVGYLDRVGWLSFIRNPTGKELQSRLRKDIFCENILGN